MKDKPYKAKMTPVSETPETDQALRAVWQSGALDAFVRLAVEMEKQRNEARYALAKLDGAATDGIPVGKSPETDKALREVWHSGSRYSFPEHARRMERERNEARAKLAALEATGMSRRRR